MKIEVTYFGAKYSMRVTLVTLDVHTHSAMQSLKKEDIEQHLTMLLESYHALIANTVNDAPQKLAP